VALEDKTEAATPRKRDNVRQEGRVAKSADLTGALILLTSLLLLRVAGPYLMASISKIAVDTFSNLHCLVSEVENPRRLMVSYGLKSMMLCLPIAMVTAVVAVAANVLQVGLKVTPKAIAPDLSRLDPMKGLTRLVSWRSLIELSKSALKVSAIGYFVYDFMRKESRSFIDLAGMPPREMGGVLAGMCWRLLIRGCVVMLIIGLLDYLYQRVQFEHSIRMTKQEVKEEYKRLEGDPVIKGVIRQRQREMARRRMMQDVAKADVIITNPTHIAVALKYEAAKMTAPTVVAKGQRLLAERIKAVAEANRVPIVENRLMARLLYETVEIGRQIPADLFQAVAEILAYVYQLSEKASGLGYRRRAA